MIAEKKKICTVWGNGLASVFIPMLPSLGKFLITVGVIFVAVGIALLFSERLSFLRMGRLPGDVIYRRGNFTFYFPVVTSILLSLILTLLFWFLGRR